MHTSAALLDGTRVGARRVPRRVRLIYPHIESAKAVEWLAEQPNGQTGGEPRLLTVNGRVLQFLARDRAAHRHSKCHRSHNRGSLSSSVSPCTSRANLYRELFTSGLICARAHQGEQNNEHCIMLALPVTLPSPMRSLP